MRASTSTPRRVARSGPTRWFRSLLARPAVRLFVSLSGLAAAAWLVRAELKDIQLAAVLAAIGSTPIWAMLVSALFSLTSYACLAVVEWQALRLIGRRLKPWKTAAASFASNALSIVMGFGLLSGTAVRLRIYAFAKLRPSQIAKLVAILSAATLLSGVVTLGLSGLLAVPQVSAALTLPEPVTAVGALLLVAPSVLWFTALRRRAGRRAPSPGRHGRTMALAANVGDWVFSGAALFILASHDLGALPAFMTVFCLGSLIGSLVGVPGGIGVLDATVLALHRRAQVHETAAALVLYRLIYFLGPLMATIAVLSIRALIKLVRRAPAVVRPSPERRSPR